MFQKLYLCTRFSSPDGGIGRRAGLKHQWGNPSRFDPGSGYKLKKQSAANQMIAALFLLLSSLLFLLGCSGSIEEVHHLLQVLLAIHTHAMAALRNEGCLGLHTSIL